MIKSEHKDTLSVFDDLRKGELLFHYTKLNNAISILSTQSLLFGQITTLNDMNESWRQIQCTHWEDNTIDLCDKELSSYVQISLTCDDNPEEKEARRGFDIATMWGHYADGGNGVCLALNKHRLFDAISKISGCHTDYVHYKNEYDGAVLFKTRNPEEEIKQRITEVFFANPSNGDMNKSIELLRNRRELLIALIFLDA